MFIADAHCDTLYQQALCHKRPEDCMVSPARLSAGGVGLQTFALYAGSNGTKGTPYDDGRRMLARSYEIGIPFFRRELPDDVPAYPCGIISCEGGEMFEGSLDKLAWFDDDSRLRLIALTWNFENEIAYPGRGGENKGLKPFGFELLKEMDRRGILADTSHLNDAGFWDVCEHSALPPVASHSCCRWLCEDSRNMTKDMVRAVIERKGFIGVNFFAGFLAKGRDVTPDDVVRHIDGMMELGGEDAVGFGSDFDGIERWPAGLADPSDFPNLLAALKRRGYTDDVLEKLAGLNLFRLLKKAEEVRKQNMR